MVESSEIRNIDELSVFTVQVAAVSWAETQIPETMLVNQSLRNTGFLKESQMEVSLIQDFAASVLLQLQSGFVANFQKSTSLFAQI